MDRFSIARGEELPEDKVPEQSVFNQKKSAQEIMKDFRPLIEILEELKKKAFFSNLSTPDHFYIREYFKKLDSKDFPIVEFKVSLEPSDYNRFEEIKAGNLFSLLFMHGVYVPIDELKDKHHYDHNGIRYSHRNGRQSIVHLTDE